MILTTCCPGCATRFRVVPDQLKIGQGWVRCGHCTQVFDARISLAQMPLEPASSTEPAAMSAVPPVLAPAPALPAAVLPAADHDLPTDPVLQVDPPLHVDLRADPQLDAPGAAKPANPEPAAEPAGGVPAALDDLRAEPDPAQDLSFMRQRHQRAAWQRPPVRRALGLAGLVLALLLLGQVLVHHRDRVAVQAPGLEPLLAAWCRSAGCQIGPPRRIDQVAIDGSSFTRLQADAYQLVLTLANQATTPVAMPAIELTLTDSQDKPVLRRVLLPSDLGADTPDRLAGGGEWSVTLTLGLTGAVGADRIAGYRVLAFYP